MRTYRYSWGRRCTSGVSLLTTHHLPLTTDYVPLTTCYLVLCATHYSLLTTYHSLLTTLLNTNYLLPTTHCLLRTTHYPGPTHGLLLTAYYSLPTTDGSYHYSLPTTHCSHCSLLTTQVHVWNLSLSLSSAFFELDPILGINIDELDLLTVSRVQTTFYSLLTTYMMFTPCY